MSDLFKPSAGIKGSPLPIRNRLEGYIQERAESFVMVSLRCMPHVFLQYCLDNLEPPASGRDTRRQRLIRAMRNMHDRGRLPFDVEEDGAFAFRG